LIRSTQAELYAEREKTKELQAKVDANSAETNATAQQTTAEIYRLKVQNDDCESDLKDAKALARAASSAATSNSNGLNTCQQAVQDAQTQCNSDKRTAFTKCETDKTTIRDKCASDATTAKTKCDDDKRNAATTCDSDKAGLATLLRTCNRLKAQANTDKRTAQDARAKLEGYAKIVKQNNTDGKKKHLFQAAVGFLRHHEINKAQTAANEPFLPKRK
jgi:hypothetical protein